MKTEALVSNEFHLNWTRISRLKNGYEKWNCPNRSGFRFKLEFLVLLTILLSLLFRLH